LERKPSPHVEPLMTYLTEKGWRTEICSVSYEFQQGGNRMLRIERFDHPLRFAASTE
jgi:hypothetical protein